MYGQQQQQQQQPYGGQQAGGNPQSGGPYGPAAFYAPVTAPIDPYAQRPAGSTPQQQPQHQQGQAPPQYTQQPPQQQNYTTAPPSNYPSQNAAPSYPPQNAAPSYPPQNSAYPPQANAGYPSQYPPQSQAPLPAAPAGADPQLWQWFVTSDAQRVGHLSEREVGIALSKGEWPPFSPETVRVIMNIFDIDRKRFLDFVGYQQAVKYIRQWYSCFLRFDADRSGTIDKNELKTAMRAFGYNVSDRAIGSIVAKYCKDPSGVITFDDFIKACVSVKSLTETFQRYDAQKNGWATMNYDQFLEAAFHSM